MTDLVLLGAGGHGREVLDLLRAAGRPPLGFLDENPELRGKDVDGIPVLGPTSWLEGRRGVEALIAIGSTRVIAALAARLAGWKIPSPVAIHPSAVVSARSSIAPGGLVFAHAFVSTGAVLGSHVTVNTGASVSHDARVGDACLLNPGARLAGGAEVGAGTMIGMGAQVLPKVRIGAGCTVGAGAVVIRDVPDGATVAGVPARAIRPSGPAGR